MLSDPLVAILVRLVETFKEFYGRDMAKIGPFWNVSHISCVFFSFLTVVACV